ncbi:MAG: hypothetical protein AB8H79_24820 [Myxococcota bacterium]
MRWLLLPLCLTGCWPYITGGFDSDGNGETGEVDPGGDAISDLRAGSSAPGTQVDVRNVEVTAVWDLGFYVQDPRGGTRDSGIHIFLDGAPPASVGERITVTGVLEDYFGELQINDANVDVLGPGTGIDPVELSAEEAASEAYEGMLVEVSGTNTNPNYSCAVDNAACRDQNLWEVGGSGGVVVWDRCFEDAGWADFNGDLPVVGVQTMRFDRRRIMPRTAGDFR